MAVGETVLGIYVPDFVPAEAVSSYYLPLLLYYYLFLRAFSGGGNMHNSSREVSGLNILRNDFQPVSSIVMGWIAQFLCHSDGKSLRGILDVVLVYSTGIKLLYSLWHNHYWRSYFLISFPYSLSCVSWYYLPNRLLFSCLYV